MDSDFTSHVITVAQGKDIWTKIISFLLQERRALCVLSATGSISIGTLRQPSTSDGTIIYQGHFIIQHFSGFFLMADRGGSEVRVGNLSVSFATPDGVVVGGSVGGPLIAASPIQVIVGSFSQSSKAKRKVRIKRGGPIIAAPIQVSAALDSQPSHDKPCFPCHAANEASKCILCVLTPLFSEQNVKDFRALLSHFGSLDDLRDRLESVNSEERKIWIRDSLIEVKTLRLERRNSPLRSTVMEVADLAVEECPINEKKFFRGLINQGATCYMNSVLQMLYHIPSLRKAVYQMPTTEEENPSRSITLHLQNLFYELQYGSQTAVGAKEFTESFGWDDVQHDVHDFKTALFLKLGDEDSVVNDKIQRLFEGHYKTYISCNSSERIDRKYEPFYDLQLDVRGCTNVYASFDKYIDLEVINYCPEKEIGWQPAWKYGSFNDFPPVLLLHLRRHVFSEGTGAKINDRYEYPLLLDLDKDNHKYLSEEADRGVRNLYVLQSVLVHEGQMYRGHYYAYIRPDLSEKWFIFDDHCVEEVEQEMAIKGQFGGEEMPLDAIGGSAYVLTYIRQSDKDDIFCQVNEKDLPRHLLGRWKDEQDKMKKPADTQITPSDHFGPFQ